MDSRLAAIAVGQGGAFSIHDAARVGVSGSDLTRLVRGGIVRRVRRGAYVVAADYVVADPPERYRMRVRAVLASRPDGERASHQSALALFGAPLWDVDLTTVHVAGPVRRVRRSGALALHPAGARPAFVLDGWRCETLPVALAQLAAGAGIAPGLIAMDWAVHNELCALEAIAEAVAALGPIGAGHARIAASLIDEVCESVGETRMRLALVDLGIPFRSQVEIRDAGGLVGRVDFLVDEWLVVEFDGLGKYAGPDGHRVRSAEKVREARLADAGYEVVRIIWSDLDDLALIRERIGRARMRARARHRRVSA